MDNFKLTNGSNREKIKAQSAIAIAYHHFTDQGLRYLNFCSSDRTSWTKALPLNLRKQFGISETESTSAFCFPTSKGDKTFIRPNRTKNEVRSLVQGLKNIQNQNKKRKELHQKAIAKSPTKKKKGESDREFRARKMDDIKQRGQLVNHMMKNKISSVREARLQLRNMKIEKTQKQQPQRSNQPQLQQDNTENSNLLKTTINELRKQLFDSKRNLENVESELRRLKNKSKSWTNSMKYQKKKTAKLHFKLLHSSQMNQEQN